MSGSLGRSKLSVGQLGRFRAQLILPLRALHDENNFAGFAWFGGRQPFQRALFHVPRQRQIAAYRHCTDHPRCLVGDDFRHRDRRFFYGLAARQIAATQLLPTKKAAPMRAAFDAMPLLQS